MSEPSANSKRITWIGGSVVILRSVEGGSWVKVKSGGFSGYIRNSALAESSGIKLRPNLTTPLPNQAQKRVSLSTGGTVGLMSEPSSISKKITWIGSSVVILRCVEGGRWIKVKSGGFTGYIRTSYVKYAAPIDRGQKLTVTANRTKFDTKSPEHEASDVSARYTLCEPGPDSCAFHCRIY